MHVLFMEQMVKSQIQANIPYMQLNYLVNIAIQYNRKIFIQKTANPLGRLASLNASPGHIDFQLLEFSHHVVPPV